MNSISDKLAARHWQLRADGRAQCLICPRECVLRDGQRGLCFVRAYFNGQMVLTTYGRSSGLCVDPIEKKPLYHFLPGTPILSFGTVGCNLTCKFCQNWDISKAREMDALHRNAAPTAIAHAARRLGCRSVAYTYNDPVIFHEYALDVAAECRALGIRSVAVTAGYVNPAAREEFYRSMDAANVDLKSFSERFYQRLCGAHLQPVLDTLKYIKEETRVWLEITTLLIPGENDSEAEIDALSSWIREHLGADVPLHLSAFHPAWKMSDKPSTPPNTLYRARDISRRNGLHYVYTGNIRHPGGSTTLCSNCGQALIYREGYQITGWNFAAPGRCSRCTTPCAGVFESYPGKWGAQRLPIRLF